MTSPYMSRKAYLSGFYETAVECKGNPFVFALLGIFVFAVAFAIAGTATTLRKIHLGLLYALEESRQGLGA
jgi:hypothetical protein